jgi:hypothetical protein
MASPIRNRQGPRESAGLPAPRGPDVGVALVPLLEVGAVGGSCLVPLPQAAAIVLAESDEVLVADPRGGLTPAQMVDQMLVARLHTGHPGLVLQAAGRPQDVRRLPR